MEQEESAPKSLEQWRFDIQRFGRKHWNLFYRTYLGASISNFGRFNKALDMYGDWPLFESIVATSGATITGDPLNYVLKVAHVKWKDSQQELEKSEAAQKSVQDTMAKSVEANETLAKHLEQARAALKVKDIE
jgi:hypothetical protein